MVRHAVVLPVFTGLDLIVVLLVVGLIIYAVQNDGGSSEIKVDPLTWLVVILVVGMIVMSFL